MTTLQHSITWLKHCLNRQLTQSKKRPIVAMLTCIAAIFFLQLNTAQAQFAGCKGCTANDDHVDSVVLVQLNPAYAGDNSLPKYIGLPKTCSGSSTVTGYLKISFSQNATTRYGISLAGNILVDNNYSSTFTYKDSLPTSSGSFVKVVENFPITYTCGTQLSLQNLFIGWGNSKGNNAYFTTTTCEPSPHCEQLPLNNEPPIVIVTPLSADFTYSGSCSAGKVAQTYSFNALSVPGGTTGGTVPYPATAYSWSIVKTTDASVNATMSGSAPTYDFSAFGPGTYSVTLTVTDDNPLAVSTISYQLTVTSCCGAANAGTNGTLNVCTGITPSDAELFAALNGTPDNNGVWTHSGNIYTYTVTAAAPCANKASATVTVSFQALPNAGTNGNLSLCTGSTPTEAQLFARLGGSPATNGTWSGPVGNVYTYTVDAISPCTGSATATVTVSYQAPPTAGDNSSLIICEGSTVTTSQLYTALTGTKTAGGSWTPTLAGAATYTYTVKATSPCTADATATVVVTTQAPPTAGDNGTLKICAGSTLTTSQLYDALTGTKTAGGLWTPTLAGAGTYTYTVKATSPCTADATATVVVTTQAPPTAGDNGTLKICAGSTLTTSQLYDALTGTKTAGGLWTPTLAGAGTYTYTVKATSPCTADATATVEVTTQAPPTAGDNGTLKICAGSTLTTSQLYDALTGTKTAGGTWLPTLAGAGKYTYTVLATSPCTTNATADVIVTTQDPPNAGVGGSTTICAGTTVTTTQLFATLTGSPSTTGSWSPLPLGGAGTYTYSVAATSPCTTPATSSVTVTTTANSICPEYSGDYFANTNSTTAGGMATVQLAFNITGTPLTACNLISALKDGDLGVVIASGSVSPNSTVINITNIHYDPTTTKLTATATVTLASNVYSATAVFTAVSLNSNYVIGCSNPQIVTISTKVDGFVTGGGYILQNGTTGSKGGLPNNGYKNNYGFNIKYNKASTKLQGDWNTIFRRMENGVVHSYQVKSSQASTLVVTQLSATSFKAVFTFTGANMKDLTSNNSTVASGLTVNVTVYDNGEPGSGIDQMYYEVMSGNTALYTTNTPVTLSLITKGNIQVHVLGAKAAATTALVARQQTDISSEPIAFNTNVLPNPSATSFTLQIQSVSNEKISLRISDITGRTVQVMNNLSPGQTLRIGSAYKQGVYFAELRQGNRKQQLKLIKL